MIFSFYLDTQIKAFIFLCYCCKSILSGAVFSTFLSPEVGGWSVRPGGPERFAYVPGIRKRIVQIVLSEFSECLSSEISICGGMCCSLSNN